MSEPMSVEAAEHPSTYNDPEPIPVSIIKDETPEKVRAATYGGWSHTDFAGTETVPVQVLRFDERRRRAVLICAPGKANGNTAGNLWIGSSAQVSNGNPSAAAVPIFSGTTITVESATDIWALPDGNGAHNLTLVVLDEIYRT